jgi:NAD(P)-dependent dehydrogenase (short-subunit alcohol dehydrogenase family)
LDHIVHNKGHVVVVASVAAFSPGAGGAPYMISKAGVAQLGRALRIELAPHGATAGVAYFGVVDTNMTHAALDESDLGREINNLLPWPLNRRISPEAAGETITRGILERAPETCAPAGWQQFKVLHGILNPILDRRLVSDSHLHRLLGRVESTYDAR